MDLPHKYSTARYRSSSGYFLPIVGIQISMNHSTIQGCICHIFGKRGLDIRPRNVYGDKYGTVFHAHQFSYDAAKVTPLWHFLLHLGGRPFLVWGQIPADPLLRQIQPCYHFAPRNRSSLPTLSPKISFPLRSLPLLRQNEHSPNFLIPISTNIFLARTETSPSSLGAAC